VERLEAEHVGMQHQLQVGRAAQEFEMGLAEVERADPAGAVVEVGRGCVAVAGRQIGAVAEIAGIDAADLVGPHVVGRQRVPSDRPAALGHPFAPGHLDRAQRDAAAAPQAGRPAEGAQAAEGGIQRMRAYRFPRVEHLAGALAAQAAAFEQADLPRRVGELRGDGDAGRSPANDADVRIECVRAGGGAGVIDRRWRGSAAGRGTVSGARTGGRYAVARIYDQNADMAKARTAYVCSECGADFSKWQGQCGACGAWDTLSEIVLEPAGTAK